MQCGVHVSKTLQLVSDGAAEGMQRQPLSGCMLQSRVCSNSKEANDTILQHGAALLEDGQFRAATCEGRPSKHNQLRALSRQSTVCTSPVMALESGPWLQ